MTKPAKPKRATKNKAAKKKAAAGLTEKQRNFVAEYPKDFNATQAAIRAGYSKNGAQQQGAQLLSNSVIQEALGETLERRVQKIGFGADAVLQNLVDMYCADPGDILTDSLNIKPLSEWPIVWRRMLSGFEVKEDFAFEDGKKTIDGWLKKIKWPDKLAILKEIGRHVDVQAFADRKVVETPESFAETLERRRLKAREQSIVH